MILATPIRNRQAKTIKETWEIQYRKFTVTEVALNMWIMENATSLELDAALKDENIKYKLVPPHNHHTNIAERELFVHSRIIVWQD